MKKYKSKGFLKGTYTQDLIVAILFLFMVILFLYDTLLNMSQ